MLTELYHPYPDRICGVKVCWILSRQDTTLRVVASDTAQFARYQYTYLLTSSTFDKSMAQVEHGVRKRTHVAKGEGWRGLSAGKGTRAA